ncbi:MAG: thiamine phosphate synthase [Deltaproteobacteria bacterium]|nr:thiamine phosphate synthase [Deltaproteobacteria bacterium]
MIDFNLYLITDRHSTGGRPLVAVIERALQGGVRAIQLRENDLPAKALFELAKGLRVLTKRYNARLFINDRVDIALAVEADGVHLGQKGFSPRDVQEIVGKTVSRITHHVSRFLIGVSTHGLREAMDAEKDGGDFITLGPIFHTPSKSVYGRPIGVDVIKDVKSRVGIPVFAIGGIKLEDLREVVEAGADGVAVISAIMGADKPGAAVKEFCSQAIWKER